MACIVDLKVPNLISYLPKVFYIYILFLIHNELPSYVFFAKGSNLNDYVILKSNVAYRYVSKISLTTCGGSLDLRCLVMDMYLVLHMLSNGSMMELSILYFNECF